MIALTAACRTLPFPDPHLEGPYGQALKKWTRKVALYSGLETRAFVRMVYLSPEFVQAQAAELSRMRAELPDQAAATLARLREEYRQPSFFAVTYFPDKTANDWSEPNSIWRIALNLGLGERPPDRILHWERPFNAEMRALWPYLDEYSTAYLLRFPEPEPQEAQATPAQGAAPPAPPGEFRPVEAALIISGAIGTMRFHWRFDGGPETPSEGQAGPPPKPAESPKP